MKSLRTHHSSIQRQRGVVFIVMMVIMVLGTASLLVSSLNSASIQIARDQVTADALAQAKEALIGYAASADLSIGRPGDLPCPDTNNDGEQETSCGNASGSSGQTARIGRLPWKTLGLPDLRDGSGERLWYAVSNNFKYNTRTTCSAPGQPGCLNSDTLGTISIFDINGTRINDGGGNTGVVAVIIAPGEVLTRQGSASVQDRSGPENGTPKKTTSNYLDIATIGGNTEDNADFIDGSSSNGFIQGRIKDGNGNIIVNDQLLVITQDNIMQAIQKRVAGEVRQCLNEYAIHPQNLLRYPWAARPNDLTYQDNSNTLFGRIPDTPFTKSCEDSGGNESGHGTNNCADTPTVGMKSNWTGNCNINSSSGWWLNWKELVFYGLANAYKPVDPLFAPAANACASAGACLSVNPPSAIADKKFVVIVAGKMLTGLGQSRTSAAEKGTPTNYLEAPNSGGATPFAQGASSTTFNDTVVFQR